MDVSTLPKNQSKERTDGRPVNEPGTYKHRDTGAIYITAAGEEGVVQADALKAPVWKDAWERVGSVPSHAELLKQRKAGQDKVETEEKAKKLKKAQKELDEAK
jgi:hypothetical protein